MAASFSDAPREIVEMIVHQLFIQRDRKSLLNLACTCRSLEALCIPLVESITYKTHCLSRGSNYFWSTRDDLISPTVWGFHKRLQDDRGSLDDYRRFILDLKCSRDEDPSPGVWGRFIQDLIVKIPQLDDFSCIEYRHKPYPVSLLNAIQRYHPYCTFHVQNDAAKTIRATLPDTSAFKMVKSPRFSGLGIDYGVNAGDESIELLLNRRSNLYNLGKRDLSGGSRRIWYTSCRAQPDSEWFQIRNEEDNASLPRESFHYLWISKHDPVSNATGLPEWADVTDLSVLQVLDLDTDVEQETLELWAMHLQFPNLRTLFLRVTPESRRSESRPVEYYRAVEYFLCGLPPLTRMCLTGWRLSVSIRSLVQHHGRCLRSLILSGPSNQYLTEEDVLFIGEHCPLLEDLTLALRRSQGDAEEVACYKALSTIRHLKHLDLTLNADETLVEEANPPQSSGVALQDTSRNERLRRLLINVAIDEKLALSIFHTISPSKTQGASFLNRLKISLGESDKAWFSLPWVIECDRTFKNRKIQAKQVKFEELECKETRHMDPELEEVFYSIWPRHRPRQRKMSKKLKNKREKEQSEGTSAWSRHWESFPLVTDTATNTTR